MEIVARRKNGLLALYSFVTLLGIFLVALSGGLNSTAKQTSSLIGGLVIIIGGVIICAGILRTPKIIIRYDGEYLLLREGKFAIDQLSQVNYRCAHVRGIRYRWGKIILNLNGRQIVYNNVADVEDVHDRLMELRLKNGK